jgi:nicotinate-nucleotide pyrophosphorylase (carboxylating)
MNLLWSNYLRGMLTTEMERLIVFALEEDLGRGDHTSASSIPVDLQQEGFILAKESGVVAGLEVALEVFRRVDSTLQCVLLAQDGDAVDFGTQVMRIMGSARAILEGERLALNFIQRMSGIATRTAAVVASLDGTGCRVLDTRKTTPGIRAFEKWAVRIGGGVNHRMGLHDMILIKDNHVDYAGSMMEAMEGVAIYLNERELELPVVVEVRNAKEAAEAMEARSRWTKPSGSPLIDRLLLDNHTPEQAAQAVSEWGAEIPLEASGGITPSNAPAYGDAGVDFISMGWLTHSVPVLDFSLKSTDRIDVSHG